MSSSSHWLRLGEFDTSSLWQSQKWNFSFGARYSVLLQQWQQSVIKTAGDSWGDIGPPPLEPSTNYRKYNYVAAGTLVPQNIPQIPKFNLPIWIKFLDATYQLAFTKSSNHLLLSGSGKRPQQPTLTTCLPTLLLCWAILLPMSPMS